MIQPINPIQQQIQDWQLRLEKLYAFIEQTVAALSDIRWERTRHTTMHEAMMKTAGIGPINLPILDIYKRNILSVTFKPVGLWVIGANGRIDILTAKASYILVDRAEKGEAPKWKVFDPRNKLTGSPFSATTIKKLVAQV